MDGRYGYYRAIKRAEMSVVLTVISLGMRVLLAYALSAVIGEVGLAGEIRAVSQAERRLAECARLGFTTAVIPRENARHLRAPEGMRVYGVETLAEALAILFG